MKLFRNVAAAAAFSLVALPAVPARAELVVPSCDALVGWSSGYNPRDEWRPNALGGRQTVQSHLVAPATTVLFGKPALDWNAAEREQAANALLACFRPLTQAGQREELRRLQQLRVAIVSNLAQFHAAAERARTALSESLAALEAQPPSPGLLGFYAALPAAARSPQGWASGQQAANAVAGPGQGSARTLLNALRDLPQDEATQAVDAVAAQRTAALRGGVRNALLAQIAALPANPIGLSGLDQLMRTTRQSQEAALGPEIMAELGQAASARRAAIGQAMVAELTAAIETVPASPEGLQQLRRLSDPRLLALLPPADAGRLRTASEARAAALADAMLVDFNRQLDALPASDDSLLAIDGQVLPGLDALSLPPAQKAKFEAAAKKRRETILASVNRAESGSLRGRVYEGAGFQLEFVDRSRVFLKVPGGQTVPGTWAEERDGRIVVTVNNEGMVLTREGKRLLGGPATFSRTK
jgi:hypothetical protein